MITIFFRREAADPLFHPRVTVVTVWDCEQGAALVAALPASTSDCPLAAGAPARQRATVAALVARREEANTRDLARRAVAVRRAALHAVP